MEDLSKFEIKVKSTLDGSLEPSLFFEAEGEAPRPLLVGLHTWSFDRFNQVKNMLPHAKKHNFHLLLPEFRGPNLIKNERRTEACCSKLAIGDILDAISYVCENYKIDRENIFLLGCSGGGHAALMTAAKNPKLFKAAASFVPITDLGLWAEQRTDYGAHVKACCVSKEEMSLRSPINYAKELSEANLKIFHGKFDPVVPFTHSLNMYLRILEEKADARVFLDIFDGGHEMSMLTAMNWLISQYSGEKLEQVTG